MAIKHIFAEILNKIKIFQAKFFERLKKHFQQNRYQSVKVEEIKISKSSEKQRKVQLSNGQKSES